MPIPPRTADPDQALRRAHQAFVGGALDSARQELRGLLRLYPAAVPVLHLLALVEKKAGRGEDARRAFLQALRHAPRDAEINTNFANLLGELGETEAALAHYGAALRANPNFAGALVNGALTLQRAGRHAEALPLAERAARLAPNQPGIWITLGLLHKELQDPDRAADALDRALMLDSGNRTALQARALVAIDHGEPQAALALFARTGTAEEGDPALALARATAHHDAGDAAAAIALLDRTVAAHPEWVEGNRALARMRWQQGDREGFSAGFARAVRARPADAALWAGWLGAEANAGNRGRVLELAAEARASAGEQASFALAEAAAASELGELERASAIFERLGEAAGLEGRLALVQHRLRAGDPAGAADVAEGLLRQTPRDQLVWALLGTAWRLLGDPRHDWLARQPGLVRATDLDRQVTDAAAEALRARHLAKAQPLDQSLRGGTQTNGALFALRDPAIRRLRDMLSDAVRAHVAALPAADPKHPLLGRPRENIRFVGSWSVRLAGEGFHVDHVHPQGWLSSACYISLPGTIGRDADRAGWLRLGQPPADLRTGLDPFDWIEPKPGRLALFPSYLWHGTAPFPAGERMTVAFDVDAG